MIFWSLSIITSVVVLVLSAAMREGGVHMAYAHMAISAAVSISFALIFVRESETMRMAGAKQGELDANAARFCGIVWAWAALGLTVTYGTNLLIWREWAIFSVLCVVMSGLNSFFADLLRKDAANTDAAAKSGDHTMLRLGRYLTMVQFACMLLTLVGLVLDGKMTHYLDLRHADWAANDIFFFGALAVAAICGYALNTKQRVPSKA